MLARSLDQKDPWVLLSRPVQWDEALVEQSFGERASERRARKTALILLGAAVLSGLVFLLFGGGPNGMAAALTSMLCMGAAAVLHPGCGHRVSAPAKDRCCRRCRGARLGCH